MSIPPKKIRRFCYFIFFKEFNVSLTFSFFAFCMVLHDKTISSNFRADVKLFCVSKCAIFKIHISKVTVRWDFVQSWNTLRHAKPCIWIFYNIRRRQYFLFDTFGTDTFQIMYWHRTHRLIDRRFVSVRTMSL